jgi:crotonobetainyl-CoA:carnitine CoA-transferase CaiB-like acyl-CoA transferase
MMAGALRGLKVLDLSRVLAGPFCCMMLGDHGAEVIKVEPPSGDETRAYGPPFTGGESAYYLALNRNKRSMVLDLSKPAGQAVVRRLAQSADVLVENFKSGTMAKWELGYEQLAALNPRLIYCGISGFGRSGPYANLAGYDAMVQAMGGLMSVNGEKDGTPTKVGIPIADLSTGLFALIGVLLALQNRSITGLGQQVEASLLASTVALLHPANTNYLHSGAVPRPVGNSHPSISPYDLLPTADRPIYVAIGNDRQFSKFTELLGRPDLAADPRFTSNPKRVENRPALLPLLSDALKAKPAREWCTAFWAAGVPAGPVNTVDQVFADPQVLQQELMQSVPHPTAGEYQAVGIPVKLKDSPGTIRMAPPLFGQHTVTLLQELGYSEEAIREMLATGVAVQGEVG